MTDPLTIICKALRIFWANSLGGWQRLVVGPLNLVMLCTGYIALRHSAYFFLFDVASSSVRNLHSPLCHARSPLLGINCTIARSSLIWALMLRCYNNTSRKLLTIAKAPRQKSKNFLRVVVDSTNPDLEYAIKSSLLQVSPFPWPLVSVRVFSIDTKYFLL